MNLFLEPDLREAESAVICPLLSMLGTCALQKSGPEADLGATNCNGRYLTYCLMFLPDSASVQIAMFADEDVEPKLCM